MDYPRIDVEATFDELVRDYGGTASILREVLPKSVSFPNADYVFHSDRVVAELKCLMDDNSESTTNTSKLGALMREYLAEGKIKTMAVTEETWLTFPKDLQLKISDIYSHSIQARVKKANVQIRETKRNLGLKSYSGLLIIANDGLISVPPAAFIDSTWREIVNKKRESISCFIYLTANLFCRVEGSPFPTVFWMPMSIDESCKISEQFLNQVRNSWQKLVNKKLGITHSFDHQIRDEDMGSFWRARHIK